MSINNLFVFANEASEPIGLWKNEDYWEWHTRNTTKDAAYNGRHIVMEGDNIAFYGYGDVSYKDFLYKEYSRTGIKKFAFIIDEKRANYHTLDGAGCILNANKSEDNKLTGYILLFREKEICLYRIEDVPIDEFEVKPNRLVSHYGTLVKSVTKSATTIREIYIEARPTHLILKEGNSELMNLDLDYSKHAGESFGLISSYSQHACSQLSKIEFIELYISIEDFENRAINVDTQKNPLTGGEFVLKDESGNVIQTGTTNENGEFIFRGLKPGTYTIQQTKEPKGYIINNNIYRFKMRNDGKTVDENSGEEIQIIIENEKIIETPVPTPIPTPVPTPIPTPVPTPIPTPVPTPIPTPVPTPIPTPIPTDIYIPTETHDIQPTYTPTYFQVDTPIPTSNQNQYKNTPTPYWTLQNNNNQSSNTDDKRIVKDTIESKPVDNTKSTYSIPFAGNQAWIIFVIITLLVTIVYLFIKIREDYEYYK